MSDEIINNDLQDSKDRKIIDERLGKWYNKFKSEFTEAMKKQDPNYTDNPSEYIPAYIDALSKILSKTEYAKWFLFADFEEFTGLEKAYVNRYGRFGMYERTYKLALPNAEDTDSEVKQ